MYEINPLKLFNTESRSLEEIHPIDEQAIRMYTCGPTVYNFAHIGNFRTYVFEDLLRRTLKFFGLKVIQAMNLTDVDDKTIKGAIENHLSLEDYTKPYIDAFFEDLKVLNIEPVEYYPPATKYIPEMITLIQKLIDKGVAYRGVDNSIYFSIRRFPSYGRLSRLHLNELKEGASQDISVEDEYAKENVADFVLWKSYDKERDGNIFWESPFGQGRPGWHIECSAMSMNLLGESIDIHVGGVDNMFPHHENEIAQCEACSMKRFVRYWLHAEHLLVDHKKMSKSLGNFYTLRDLLAKGYTGPQVRYMLLQTHYRTQLNFTMQGLDAAGASLERFSAFIYRLKEQSGEKSTGEAEKITRKTAGIFRNALAEDLNISASLAALFDMIREINGLIDNDKVGKKDAAKVLEFLEEIDRVLGILPLKNQEVEIPQALEDALQLRQEARKMKNWVMADHYRDLILSRGYVIEDTPTGARLKKS